jgi:hypothetical protein
MMSSDPTVDGLQLVERERLRPSHPNAWNQTSDCPPEEVLLRSNASLGCHVFPSMGVWDRLQKSSITQHLPGGEVLWYPVAAAVDLEYSLTTDGDLLRHIASCLSKNVGGIPSGASAQHLALRTLYGVLFYEDESFLFESHGISTSCSPAPSSSRRSYVTPEI